MLFHENVNVFESSLFCRNDDTDLLSLLALQGFQPLGSLHGILAFGILCQDLLVELPCVGVVLLKFLELSRFIGLFRFFLGAGRESQKKSRHKDQNESLHPSSIGIAIALGRGAGTVQLCLLCKIPRLWPMGLFSIWTLGEWLNRVNIGFTLSFSRLPSSNGLNPLI